MIKFNGLVPCRREWSVSAASSLSGLALALTVGFVSMSVLLQSDDALAVDDCGSFVRDIGGTVSPGKMSADQRTGNIWMSSGGGVLGNRGCGFPTGTFSDAYTSGSERDRATTGLTDYNGFPLTAKADGTDPDTPSKGNIVYNLKDFVVFQTYDHDGDGNTAEVRRPWWQARCTADTVKVQMCWTTIAGTVTAPPSGETLYYRMVDADSSIDYTGDYSEGPPVSRDDVNTLIVRPSAPTDQIAVKVQNSAGNLEDAAHTKNLFIKSSWDAEDSIEYNGIVTLNLGWRDGIVVRGIKERIYRPGGGGLAERVPRSRVNGVDEDGFERYAVTFDTSTDIGLHVKRVRLISEGNANKHSVFEGGADKVSTIENGQINTEGGSKDGGGIEFGGGQAKEMFLKIGEVRAGNHNSIVDTVRDTVIARSAGEYSDESSSSRFGGFHAVHFHHDMEGEQGGKGEILVIDTTITMLNGGSSPEEGRGMIVTTGADSSGITISVTNPLGTDTTDDEFKGIGVRVDTPVTVKTSGARSHGIVLNLGYGEGQEENTALYQRAAVLLEAKDRNTLLQVGLTEGTVEKSLADGGLAFANGYRPSVRIATNGAKSGGIVIRNEGDAGAGGQAVNLLGFTPRRWAGQWSDTQSFSSDLGDLENYHLIVDKPIVTTGAGSHGVVASIGKPGITMVVDIEDLGLSDDLATTDVDESATISASGSDSMALSGTFSAGADAAGGFTVNVKGNVKGSIETGDGVDTVTVGVDAADDDDDKSPTITGGIDAGGGDDTVNVVLGSVTGTVNSGVGCDKVELKAGVTSVGGVTLGLCEAADQKNELTIATAFDGEIGDITAGGTTELNLADGMDSDITLTGSGTTKVNRGTTGDIEFSATSGNTKVVVGTSTNQVTINGNIQGGAGNDEVELTAGTMFRGDDDDTDEVDETTMITLGGGDDTLTYTAVRGTATANARRNLPDVEAGAGCDTITLKASGSTGTGTDSAAGGIDLGAACDDGMDRLTSTDVVIAGDIDSSGNSQIRLTGGSVENMDLGAGTNDVELGDVAITGDIESSGQLELSLTGGSLNGNLALGAGNDEVELSSGTMFTVDDASTTDENEASTITLGDGDDTLTYTAFRLSGDASAAANARRNLPAVNAGGGCDTITLRASGSTGTGTDSAAGGIDLGAACDNGMDRLTSSNVAIAGDIDSSGNSQISLTGGSVRDMDLGAGTNNVELRNVTARDIDNSGNSQIRLNGGSVRNMDLGAGTNDVELRDVAIAGNIESSGNSQIRLNGGSLNGNLALGGGNDEVELSSGTMFTLDDTSTTEMNEASMITLGGGDDTLTYTAVRLSAANARSNLAAVDAGAGCDTITLRASGSTETGADSAASSIDLGAACDGGMDRLTSSNVVIAGDIDSSGNSQIRLTGGSVRNMDLGAGTNDVELSNVAARDIESSGNSQIRLTGGSVRSMDLGAGTSDVELREVAIAGNIESSGQSEISLTGGSLNGNLALGAGNDEVELSSGTMFAVDDASTTDENEASMITLGGGDDTLTYTAVRLSAANARRNLAAVDAGAGCDTITLRGSGSTGTGADSAAGGIDLGAACDSGMDRLTSNIVINGNIESSGNSQIRLNGGSLNGNLALGAGNDDVELGDGVTISGTVSLGNGNNHWRGGGTISGTFVSGTGNDIVVLGSSYRVTTVNLGAGNNRLTSSQTTPLTSITSASAGASGSGGTAQGTTVQLNSGRVSGGMTFGAGNDIARWVDAVTVGGAVNLGGGDDTVVGGMLNGSIVGGDGDDSVTLRGGMITSINGGNGDDSVTLHGGTVTSIFGGDGDDTVAGIGSGPLSVTTIDGGDGDDTVTLRNGMVTSMTGVETFNKMGASTLTIGSMSNPAAAASTLSGSTADAGDAITVNVNEGRLVVSGHLNLGSTGRLTVRKDAFLSFDVGGMAAQYNEDGEPVGTPSHGRITAGQVVMLATQPEIGLVSGSDDDNSAATVARLITGKVVRQAGDDDAIVPAIVSGGDTPRVVVPPPPAPGTTPTPAAADDDDNTAIYAVGALAVLWWVMRRDDMDGSGLVDYESGTAESSFAGDSGSQMKTWANYYSDSTSPVQGLAVGLEAPISSNGSFSFTAMPEAKGSLGLNTLNQKSSFQGGHYSVKGKWQSEDYFATAELSYADAVSSTSFDNPTAGGKLSGKFDMSNSHLEIGAGAKLQLTDTLSVAPTVGVYGGSISQSESVLTGRSVVARMSRQEQSYTGWNLGIRVQPDAWATDGAKFQPNFSLNTFRTSSDSRSVDLRQSDKAGVLDFSSQLPVQGMPAVVNAFRAGMTMKSETGLQLDLDYVGMEIDGELQHGAIARMQTRF